uniref:Uncharacterized protein n=1 Tax=Meloidogyne incognita TaxID=6306 RepID=A0A914LD64_MELIC
MEDELEKLKSVVQKTTYKGKKMGKSKEKGDKKVGGEDQVVKENKTGEHEIQGVENEEEKEKKEEEKEEGDDDDEDEEDDDEDEGNTRLGTLALLEGLYMGKGGFGKGEKVVLTLENIPKIVANIEKNRLSNIKETARRIYHKCAELVDKIIENVEDEINGKLPPGYIVRDEDDLSPSEVKDFKRETSKTKKEDKAESSKKEEEVDDETTDDETTPLLGKEHDYHVSEVEVELEEKNAASASKGHGEEEDIPEDEKHETTEEIMKKMRSLDKKGKEDFDKKLKKEIAGLAANLEKELLEEIKKEEDRHKKLEIINKLKNDIKEWKQEAERQFEQKIQVKEDEEVKKKLKNLKIHPFDFLQTVSFDVRIKPLDKRFKNISGLEYEDIVHFFKNHERFNEKDGQLNQKAIEFLYNEFKEIRKDQKNEALPMERFSHLPMERPNKALTYLNEEFKKIEKNVFQQGWDWIKSKFVEPKPEEDFGMDVMRRYEQKIKEIDQKIEKCYQLKEPIKRVISRKVEEEDVEMYKEFRGRLGAQILLSVYNAKQLTKDIAYGMALSLVGAGFIGTLLDVFIWPAMITAMAHVCPFLVIPFTVFLYSLTPLFAETFDSFVIKRFLNTLQGGKFLPSSMKEFLNDLNSSWIAGNIAAGGSVLNNWIELFSRWSLLGLNVFTNQIASSTSGALVPLEFAEWEQNTRAALFLKYSTGFFPKPDVEYLTVKIRKDEKDRQREKNKKFIRRMFNKILGILPQPLGNKFRKKKPGYDYPAISDGEKNEKLRMFIESKVKASMKIEKTAAMSVNSMGIGALLSFLTFIPMYFASKYDMVPETLLKITTILINTPTEILSFGVGILTANGVGVEWMEKYLSTDTMKNKQMVRMIFDRTMQQYLDVTGKFNKISEEEVYTIFHPKLAGTFGFGSGVVKTMLWTSEKLVKAYCSLTDQPFPKSLFDQINMSKLALPLLNEEELEDRGFYQAKIHEKQIKMVKMAGMSEDKWESFYIQSSTAFYLHKLTFTEIQHYLISLKNAFSEDNLVNNGVVDHTSFLKLLQSDISKGKINKSFDAAYNKARDIWNYRGISL